MVVVACACTVIHCFSAVDGVLVRIRNFKFLTPFGITRCQIVSNLATGESGVVLGCNTRHGGCAIYLIAVCKFRAAGCILRQLAQRIAICGAACRFVPEQGRVFRSVAAGNSGAVRLGQVTAHYADGV